MRPTRRLHRMLTLGMALAAMGTTSNAAPDRPIGIDHILIGVPDLERTVDELATAFGVRPVYGGKHPRGTHNALLSLGPHTYLELIALQPGVAGAEIGMGDLVGLTRPVPIGWAVGAPSPTSLAAALAPADFSLHEPQAGSRTTPTGETLRWQVLDLTAELEGAPFFIVWSPETHHPATTSPPGCRLVNLQVTTPGAKKLRALCSALNVPVEVVDGPSLRYSVALDCPNGAVTFRTDS